MGSIRDEVIDKYDEYYLAERKKSHEQTINRLMSEIGTTDETIRKVVEVLYRELKRF